MVRFIYKVGMMAKIGVATMPTKVENRLVETELIVVKMVVRIVIRHIFT